MATKSTKAKMSIFCSFMEFAAYKTFDYVMMALALYPQAMMARRQWLSSSFVSITVKNREGAISLAEMKQIGVKCKYISRGFSN